LDAILAYPVKVTAAIVANDWGCVGLYRACAERGIRIPEDLSVLGFDNQISICVSLSPPLTSINNPLKDIGKTATIELLSRIDAKSRGIAVPINSRQLSGTLVERNSLAFLTDNHKETE
jgi:Transcriptional regulators